MAELNCYQHLVSEYAHLIQEGRAFPLGGFEAPARTPISSGAPKALFFAPHPDDECIVGGLAVRLMREAGMNLINVAVTQGSRKERQGERLRELQAACRYLGFGLITTGPNGLERVNLNSRKEDPAHWSRCVEIIAEILRSNQPRVILFPHEHDWNSTHIGTHFLVMDALERLGAGFECYLVETEIWGQMEEPNLMAEISAQDLTDMIIATSFHVGEVKRNPYHLLLPAWMLDNVRRGAELVGGQGGTAPRFTFAALYRVRKWRGSRAERVFDGGRQISSNTNINEIFP